MNILIALGVLSLCIGVLMVASSMTTLHEYYSQYRETYDSLSSRTFYINFNHHVYSHKMDSPDDGFVWFLKDNDFLLTRDCGLFDTRMIYLDPYSFYWLCKYRRWFKKNVDVNKLEKFSD